MREAKSSSRLSSKERMRCASPAWSGETIERFGWKGAVQFASVVAEDGEESYTATLCQQCYNKNLVAKGAAPMKNWQWCAVVEKKAHRGTHRGNAVPSPVPVSDMSSTCILDSPSGIGLFSHC